MAELEKIELASPNTMVQTTFDHLQHFISSSDVIDAWLEQNPGKTERDIMKERTLPTITINLDNKINKMFDDNGTAMLWINYLGTKYSLSHPVATNAPGLFYSRLYEGTSVMASYQKGQSKRAVVNTLEIATASAIFKEVASVKTGYKDIISSILGGPFFVSLIKSDLFGSSKKSGSSKKKAETPSSRINEFVRQRTGGNKKESTVSDDEMGESVAKGGGETETTKSLFDLPDQILMDKMTQQVMQEHWIPFLEKVCEYSLTVGITPFYYKEIIVSVPVYTLGDASVSSGSEDDYDPDQNGESIARGEDEDVGGYAENGDKSIRGKESERIPGYDTYRPEYGFTGTGGEREELFKSMGVEVEKYDVSGEGLASYPFDKGPTIKSFVQGLAEYLNVTVNSLASDPISTMFKTDLTLSNAGKNVNGPSVSRSGGTNRDPLPLMKDVLNQGAGTTANGPIKKIGGIVVGNLKEETRMLMDDILIRMEAERETLEDRMKMLSEKETREMEINSLEEDMVQKRLRLYSQLEALLKDIQSFKLEWRTKFREFSDKYGTDVQGTVPNIPVSGNLKGMKDPDDFPDYFDSVGEGSKKKRRYPSSFSQEAEEGSATATDEDALNETRRKRRKLNLVGRTRRESGRAKKLSKEAINVPHYVPMVPDFGKGHLETYSDGSSRRYCWVWDDGKGDSSKVEPFMHFVVYSDCDKDGHLKSPISSMISTYNKLKKAELKIEEQEKENDLIFYSIESPPLKEEMKDKRWLDSRSFEPTFSSGAPDAGPAPVPAASAGVGSLFLNSQDPYAPTGGLYSVGEGGGRHPSWDGCVLQPDAGGNNSNGGNSNPNAVAAQREINEAKLNQYMLNSPVQVTGPSEGCYGDANCNEYTKAMRQQEVLEYQTQNLRGMRTAEVSSLLLGRPCTYVPGLGVVVVPNPGEKFAQVTNREPVDTTRVEKLKKRLNEEGGIVCGYPLVMFQDVESKGPLGGRQSEQALTTKSEMRTQNTQNAGFFVPNVSKNSTEELRKMNKDDWVKHFTRTVIELFKVAYGNLYKSTNPWYKQIIEKTFEITDVESAPDFYSLFDVNVTFPLNAPADMNVMLALYNLGAVKGRDMALLMTSMASKFTGSLPKGYMEVLSQTVRAGDYQTGEDEIIKNLEKWKGFERERVEALIEVERAKAEKDKSSAASDRANAKNGGTPKANK